MYCQNCLCDKDLRVKAPKQGRGWSCLLFSIVDNLDGLACGTAAATAEQ